MKTKQLLGLRQMRSSGWDDALITEVLLDQGMGEAKVAEAIRMTKEEIDDALEAFLNPSVDPLEGRLDSSGRREYDPRDIYDPSMGEEW